MIIIHGKESPSVDECSIHMIIRGVFSLEEEASKLYTDLSLRPVVDIATDVGWFAVPEQRLPPVDYDEEEIEIERTVGDLNLTYFTADTLPKSQHIARLKVVNPSAVRPATVTRRFMGELYDVDCFVTQGVKDQYTAGDISMGDFVIVSYTRTGDDEETLPIVTGKVFESW